MRRGLSVWKNSSSVWKRYEVYKFDDKDSIVILPFRELFKVKSNSTKLLKGMAQRILFIFKNENHLPSLTIQMSRCENNKIFNRLQGEGEKQSTFIIAMIFLLRFYATESINEKVRSQVDIWKKTVFETAVQFTGVLRYRIVCCGNAYSV